jgi:hypothetical protein
VLVAIALLGVASIGITIGGVIRAAAVLRSIARALRSSKIAPSENAMLYGRVGAIDLVDSPLSDRRGVYVLAQRERWSGPVTSVPSGGNFRVIGSDEEAAPFRVANVLVDPTRGSFDIPSTSWLAADERHTEAVLAPGQAVVVTGKIEPEGGFDPSDGYRGSSVRLVMRAGARGLHVTTARAYFVWRAVHAIAALAVAGAMAFPLYVATVWIGNHHPIVTMDLPGEPIMRGPPRDEERGASHLWRAAVPEGARAVGPARIEIWVLGDVREQHSLYGDVTSHVFTRACDAFWARQLDGLSPYREQRRREWLVFEVIEWEGTAYHDPETWEAVCAARPDACPSRLLKNAEGV